jgi:hypothetical protein
VSALEHPGRPVPVRQAIAQLGLVASQLDATTRAVTDVAVGMRALGIDTSELASAGHELEHAWSHITKARRAIRMAWPAEGDPDE